MENNYTVYQHVTPDNMYYFGQSQNVEKRWECNGIHYKETALYPYIEKYGWDNIQHIILFENQTRENALWIENFLIETAREDGVCINKNRSGFVSKEDGYKQRQQKQYREQNKDKIKQYREQNKDKILEYQQQYREQNKEQIREQQKQYYEENKEQIREQQKQYYEENKDKIKQYYEQNKQRIREYQRKYYQRKKEEKQPDGCFSLW